MKESVKKLDISLQKDPRGVYRIGDTRVTLEAVLQSYRGGANPEEIVQEYPALSLVEVYEVISYYLRHKEELNDYLERREDEIKTVRKKQESRLDTADLQNRLQARK